MKGCGAGRRSQHKRKRALEAGAVRALLPAAPAIASRERRSFRTAMAALGATESRRRSLSRHSVVFEYRLLFGIRFRSINRSKPAFTNGAFAG